MLSEYNFKIIHVPGKQNNVADCLSRIQIDKTPKDISEFMNEENETGTINLLTRSMAKAADQAQKEKNKETKKVPETEFKNTYIIHENNIIC